MDSHKAHEQSRTSCHLVRKGEGFDEPWMLLCTAEVLSWDDGEPRLAFQSWLCLYSRVINDFSCVNDFHAASRWR